MAYFPNGTSAEIAMKDNCYLCRNWKKRGDEDSEGCPISDIHYRNNYLQCKDSTIKSILDMLWPSDKDGFPGKCSMFESNGECKGQMTFSSESTKNTS